MRRHVANMPFNPFALFFPEDDEETMFRRFLDGGPEGHDMDVTWTRPRWRIWCGNTRPPRR